ncbi:MAG TPA: hypothetical protein VHZ54_19770 [Solirubrobacterales bacterium]|jgi:hypothetical protein|nr:hypothetical protein [Solirubrobacterales bacterium]
MSSEQTTKENLTMNARKPNTVASRLLTRRAVLVAALFALGAMLLPVASAGAAGTPAWSISSIGMPLFAPGAESSFGSGPQFYVRVVNVGSGPATGPITITDTVSGPVGIAPAFGFGRDDRGNEVEECAISGQTATCIDDTNVGPIEPGQQIQLPLALTSIPAGASGTVVNHVTVSGGSAASASTTSETPISPFEEPWGFLPGKAGFETVLRNSSGAEDTEAGTHPYSMSVTDHFPAKKTGFLLNVPEHLHDLRVDLPAGVILNPNSTPVRCTEKQLESDIEGEGCPPGSQVGTIGLNVSIGGPTTGSAALYNMVPPPGHAAEFGFDALGLGIYVHFMAGVRFGPGGYRETATANDINAKLAFLGTQVNFWGEPSDESHDWQRSFCSEGNGACPLASTQPTLHPLLTMPTACPGERTVEGLADSWENEGIFKSASYTLPSGVSGCAELEFEPSLEARPTTEAGDAPTGLNVDVHVPQTNGIDEDATPNLKKAVVTLPEGLVVNPSGANGLEACTSAQIGFDDTTGLPNDEQPTCPNGSKIGEVEVDTPLLPNVLPGSIYIAKPFDNPFNSLLAIYAVVNDPETGVLLKLAGHVEPDPNTGRLVTTFDNNPQLPFTDFKLKFFGGAGATLRTPAVCGTYSTTSQMTPWSAPESGPPATPADTYAISSNCASSEGSQANSPSFEAGTESPIAGKYTPFSVHLKREDGTQQFSKLTISPPPGLIAKLAGTPACSDAALNAAAGMSGRDEQANPSCPANTKIGTVHIGAGAGPAPYYTDGTAYLAGPYKSAPLSMAIITPAVAGPFDLGTVVTRVALRVNPATTQITAEADPIPSILQGIPLDVRSIDLVLDKPEFTRTGTSCNPLAVTGLMTSTIGQGANLQNRYQLGNCANLSFGPSLSVRMVGPTKRAKNPKLVANLNVKEGEANISAVSVLLAHSSFLDQGHIKTVCTRVQFAAGSGNGAACPPGSIYGKVQATSPVLGYPLTGNVYLRSSSNKLPDLVAALNGPAYQPIAIELDGRVDSVKGAMRNSFETVPDAPVSSFRLELFGGKRGLIVNSRNLCTHTYRATIKMTAQNGDQVERRPAVKAQCSAKSKKKAKGKGHKKAKGKGHVKAKGKAHKKSA